MRSKVSARTSVVSFSQKRKKDNKDDDEEETEESLECFYDGLTFSSEVPWVDVRKSKMMLISVDAETGPIKSTK